MQVRSLGYIAGAAFILGGCLPGSSSAQPMPTPSIEAVPVAQSEGQVSTGGKYRLEVQNIGTQDTPITASFLIFTHGTKRVFTDPRYQMLSDLAYLMPSSATTVYVARPGVTWQEFFDTLPMKLSAECLQTGTGQEFCSGQNGRLRFFLNGQSEAFALTREIRENDRLLVTFGNETELELRKQLDQVPFGEEK